MEIKLGGQKLRITNYEQKTFVDVSEPKNYEHYAHQLNIYPTMHFVAIVEIENYHSISIVIFPDKEVFDEWVKNSSEKVKIIKILTPKQIWQNDLRHNHKPPMLDNDYTNSSVILHTYGDFC